MRQRKNLRDIIGILKDKASLIKETLLSPRHASPRAAVLRATTHDASAPPPEHHVSAVLAHGDGPRHAAGATVEALMDRLHRTHTAPVALKCLYVLHSIAARGSFILRDQLSFYPSTGGRNFLNLSTFIDKSEPYAWELSSWVRWYAAVLERSLTASRVLGSYFCSSSRTKKKDKEAEKISGQLNSELLEEMGALVTLVEEICEAPESLHLQKNNLVYEVVRLVGKDYGLAQHEIFIRMRELGDRTERLSSDDSAELIRVLERLEDCKEKLVLLFVNRQRNDLFWDLVGETKTKLLIRKKEQEERRLVAVARRGESSELTRYGGEVAGRPEQLFRMSVSGSWLDADRLALTVSAVG
ncbi:putative clathrin assembly protein At4g40080 [Malania oleifera]|uniref:putative clathrin assembly protein At4g40080 n=1 Tax=Malania oleifera TaxID=397392 RepID=UPI0025AEC040|nr:putative clathrin assembly protein At4g40080 [Malania oleifera]